MLDVAGSLTGQPIGTEAAWRRAVSTAYYAIFHLVSSEAAFAFSGGRQQTGAYALIARGFEHTTMRLACDEMIRPTLRPRVSVALLRDRVSADAQEFALAFTALQQLRNVADDDPLARFSATDATSAVSQAANGMAAFRRLPEDERLDLLAFLLVRFRG